MKRFILFSSILGLLSAPALSAQEDKVEYIPTRLSDTVTMVKGRGGNIAVSAGEDGVFIVDDQMKPLTEQLLAAIREIDDRPVRFVINTHYHGDHVGGAVQQFHEQHHAPVSR
jgi:glyoxylase-like metal-dependent hydrolase (beta-lactamase superfamily II)